MKTIENQEAYDAAVSRNMVANARKTFDSTLDIDGKIARFLAANTWNSFYESLNNQLLSRGSLSIKQVSAVREAISKQQSKLDSKAITTSEYTPKVVECFTISMLNDGTFAAVSSKNECYQLGHFYAKTEQQAISKAKRQFALHAKHVAMLESMSE